MLRRHFTNVSYSKDIKPNEIWYKTSNNEKFEYGVLFDFLNTAGYKFINFLVANVQVNDGWWCLRFAKNLNSIGVATTDSPVETILMGMWDFYGYIETNILNITEIKLPNIFLIGENAFPQCENLQFITIPDSVTSIGKEAFQDCESLISIVIPNGVTSIGKWAFQGCTSLTSVTIGNSVTSIGEGAFQRCTFIKDSFINNSSLDAEANNYWGAEIADVEIDGLLIRNDTVIGCRQYVTSVTIPNSITSIGYSAFDSCSSLTSITIPNSVTSIGDSAFYECSSLTSITFEGTIEQWNAVSK